MGAQKFKENSFLCLASVGCFGDIKTSQDNNNNNNSNVGLLIVYLNYDHCRRPN